MRAAARCLGALVVGVVGCWLSRGYGSTILFLLFACAGLAPTVTSFARWIQAVDDGYGYRDAPVPEERPAAPLAAHAHSPGERVGPYVRCRGCAVLYLEVP